MNHYREQQRSRTAAVVFELLDPLPYAFFVAALIFDAIYADSAEIIWMKSAAWLICIGLLLAVIPRLINLAQVWITGVVPRPLAVKLAFWLNCVAIVVATINAFVHSRDAYASMPEGLALSVLTVFLLVIGNVALTLNDSATAE